MADLDTSPIMQLAGEGEAEALRALLREKALSSLYYFAKVVMNFDKMVQHLHLPFCEQLQTSIVQKKRGFLWPRGHFKSTVMKAYVLWRLCGGARDQRTDISDPRNLRILFVGESSGVAESKLKDIRWNIENNQMLQWLFPEIIPNNFNAVKWTDAEIEIPRSQSFDEPTVTAVGVGGKTTGKHYDIIVYDDIIGEKASKSEAVMQEAITWFQFAPGLLNEPEVSEELIAGTRWKAGSSDLYGWIMENMPYGVKPHNDDENAVERHSGFIFSVRAAREPDPETGELKPIFPERFSNDTLDEILKREKMYKFSCNYMNCPTAPEGTDFNETLIREYEVLTDKAGLPCIIHPLDGTPDVKLSQLFRISFNDPSSGGVHAECENALVVVGMSTDRRIFCLSEWGKNCGYGYSIHEWHKLNDQFVCHVNYYEAVGSQKVIGEEIVPQAEFYTKCIKCEKRHRRLNPHPVMPPGGKDKEQRIRLFAGPAFEDCRVYLRAGQYVLRSQITSFPFNNMVDRFDAFAYAIHLLRPPKPQEEIDSEKIFEEERRTLAVPRTNTEYNYGGYV